jgi:DnaJ-class molecular chaperone
MGHAADVFTSPPGDLLLTIKIKEHEFYTRSGNNIHSEVPLTLLEAMIGAKITVMTIDGPLTVETKPGVSSGDTMTLKHLGVPEFSPPDGYDPRTLRGHHVLTFKVILPEYHNSDSAHDQALRQLFQLDQQHQQQYYAHCEGKAPT